MTDAQTPSPNDAQVQYWNSAATRPWAEQHERQDRALATLATAALNFAAPQPGEHVLDIGCGSGTTVLELAARVGPLGHVLGADVSEYSVLRARERIAAADLRHAEVIKADVSNHPFVVGKFDLAFSRLGVMFFGNPTTAFMNVHRAMKPMGRLALAVFRPARENPWTNAPVSSVRHLLPPMPLPAQDAPGMFSWSEPSRVHQILEGAGFREVSLTPVDLEYQLAGTGGAAEAAEFALLFGPLTRMSGLSPERREAVRSTLENFFKSYVTPQGVVLPSAYWIVQARA